MAHNMHPGSDNKSTGYYSQGVQSEDAINYSFRSNFNLSGGSGENYAFFSEGTASSYFRGGVRLLQPEQMYLITMKKAPGRPFSNNQMGLEHLVTLLSQQAIRE